jgi:4-amino-4-deoxy-L-arabinose transferase-like glycosyltransferase
MTAQRVLLAIIILGLALRLLHGLSQDPLAPYSAQGGDTIWYLANGYALVNDLPSGSQVRGYPVDIARLTTPPVYLLLIGIPQVAFDEAGAILVIRALQAFLSAATIAFAAGLAGRLAGPRAMLIAAAAVAFSPVFILEAADIRTETTYLFFVTGGLWAYVEALCRPHPARWLAAAAVLFGLATLTRAVFLLFPLLLAVHWLMAQRGQPRRSRWPMGAALLIGLYALLVSTWTIYNLARWERFVVAGEGLPAFLYLGATGWEDPEAVDRRLVDTPDGPAQADFLSGTEAAINADPLGYAHRRLGELAGAYLQPHGTLFFPGPGLRELALGWLRDDRSPGGLAALAGEESFWPKLALYLLHFSAILLGLLGMWRTRQRWRISLPLAGFIAYTTLIHLILLALPRYLFPTLIVWWVFAAAALAGRAIDQGAPSGSSSATSVTVG